MFSQTGGHNEESAELSIEEVLGGWEFPADLLGGRLDKAEIERFEAFGHSVVGGENGANG